MQRADFKVVLDACALANARVCNVLLMLAESPRLYLPRWSDEILEETRRTHFDKLGWEAPLADSFQSNLREYFPEALILTTMQFLLASTFNDSLLKPSAPGPGPFA